MNRLHPEKQESWFNQTPEHKRVMDKLTTHCGPYHPTEEQLKRAEAYRALEAGMHVQVMVGSTIETRVIYDKIGEGCFAPICLKMLPGETQHLWVEVDEILKSWHPDETTPCQPT